MLKEKVMIEIHAQWDISWANSELIWKGELMQKLINELILELI